MEVNLQITGRKSNPAPVSKNRRLALTAVDQNTQDNFTDAFCNTTSIILPVHKPPIYSRNLSLTGSAALFLVMQFLTKTSFRGQTTDSFKEAPVKRKDPQQNAHYASLLEDPFSFFLPFCYAAPHKEQLQQIVFPLEWKAYSDSLRA